MKCEYCKYQGKCGKKFYECDRQLVIRNNELTCESAHDADYINGRMKYREYRSVEKVTFLGLGFNRVKLSNYNQ